MKDGIWLSVRKNIIGHQLPFMKVVIAVFRF